MRISCAEIPTRLQQTRKSRRNRSLSPIPRFQSAIGLSSSSKCLMCLSTLSFNYQVAQIPARWRLWIWMLSIMTSKRLHASFAVQSGYEIRPSASWWCMPLSEQYQETIKGSFNNLALANNIYGVMDECPIIGAWSSCLILNSWSSLCLCPTGSKHLELKQQLRQQTYNTWKWYPRQWLTTIKILG